MRKMVFVSMLVGLTVLLAACGGSAPMQESASSKDVNIVVASNPSPAKTGDVELLLTITDKGGNPVEGAKVDVGADHTDMSGMGMSGLATDQGGGKYSIKANFDESGNWMLTVKVTKASLDYKEDIEFKVQ
jgi:uncharacterized GH25 family protein